MHSTQKTFDEAFLKKLEELYITSKKIVAGTFRAKRKTRIVGSGIEFADFRSYTPGDDLRNIDWRIFARTEKLFLRLFEEEEDLTIYFLLDTSRSMQLGSYSKLSYAKEVVAALGYIGLSNLDRVSVVPFSSELGGRLPPSRGKGQVFKIFSFLESLVPGNETSLGDAFRSFVAQNKRRGMAVVLSDFYDPEGFERGMNYLRYHKFEPLVIQIYDERELEFSLMGDIELIDCETGARRELTITPALMKAYANALSKYRSEVEDYCNKRQILYFSAPMQVPFDDLILRVFRAGGFVN
jgi:uncharacterized protein (DUF58 family)